MSLDTTKQIKSVTYNGTDIPLTSGTTTSNIITFEYTPTDEVLTIPHDVLVGAGIDTKDKFFKIIGISIFPKNGDVDWFYVSYGGILDHTFGTSLLYHHSIKDDEFSLAFYASSDVPYTIALQNLVSDQNAVNKTFIVTLLLNE